MPSDTKGKNGFRNDEFNWAGFEVDLGSKNTHEYWLYKKVWVI